MTEEDKRIPSATYGRVGEFILMAASIAAIISIYTLRPEYFTFSSAFLLFLCTWYAFRTVVDYVTEKPIVVYLVRLQDPRKKSARLFIVGLVNLILLSLYVGMLTRYF